MFESNSKKHPETFSSNKEKDNIVAAIALRIRESLDLNLILDRAVVEIRQFIQTDRVLIYRFEPDLSGVIVAESANDSADPISEFKIEDPCFSIEHIEKYREGQIKIVENVKTAGINSCYRELLSSLEVKANLVVPIIANDRAWGLLIVHHCQSPRQWLAKEIELLKQLSIQVSIAVQQAELYQQVKSFNSYLEQKVKQRTSELQTTVKFESLIRKITEKVRDSLDEPQILQTVTREIGEVLNIERCKIELYNSDRTIATVAYEYTIDPPNCQGVKREIKNFAELYGQLLQKRATQFVEKIPELSPIDTQATRLACPIFDDAGILGNLWLLRPKEKFFQQYEVSLVEQVASQCAIAIRQARLYKQSQEQLQELSQLNLLKDDFLRTISHELRTPMSSIQLASETLEVLLEQQIGSNKSATFTRVLNIFRSACQRQNQLVDDLLTLCYIDAKKEVIKMQWIDLKTWLPQIIEPFQERIEAQNQTLVINIKSNLPQFKSDISIIKRILLELINNACKYTPAEETITFSARAIDDGIKLKVVNTGIEISPVQQNRVFDKFYRIPNCDPWKFGGTGIGLALVKNLIGLLKGKIYLESQTGKTAFTVELPCETAV